MLKTLEIERPGDPILNYSVGEELIKYAATEMRSILAELDRTVLIERTDLVLEKVERAIQLRYDYEHDKHDNPLAREEARKMDGRIDRTISSLKDGAEVFTNLEGDNEQKELAEELIEGLFSTGVAPITNQTYTKQHARVEELVGRLRGEYTPHIETLNLGAMVDQLEELNDQFGGFLNPDNDSVEYDEVQAASVEAEDEFHRLLIETMAEFADDLETLNRVFEPIFEQSERVQRHLQRTGSIPEGDPEQGAPAPDGGSEGSNDGESSTDGESSGGGENG